MRALVDAHEAADNNCDDDNSQTDAHNYQVDNDRNCSCKYLSNFVLPSIHAEEYKYT